MMIEVFPEVAVVAVAVLGVAVRVMRVQALRRCSSRWLRP
jgi:hypothetical protein